jgi:hypothetical protein
MDLLECATCELRFLVSSVDGREAWQCPDGAHPLRLVARSLPGSPDQIEAALGAKLFAAAEQTSMYRTVQ